MGPSASFLRRFSVFAILILISSPAVFASAGADDPPAPPEAPAPEPSAPERPRYRLEPVVITANRFPIRLDRVPADITVITPERLEARRPLFLAEALRDAPGVDVQRSGSTG